MFFLYSGCLASISWKFYTDAWKSLAANKVLYRRNVIEEDPAHLKPLTDELSLLRPYLTFISIVLGAILTSIDAGCLWGEYGIMFYRYSLRRKRLLVAFRLEAFAVDDKLTNGLFIAAIFILQGVMIAIASFTLLQILAHGIASLNFENLKHAQKNNLSLKLNITDPHKEFGLEKVNEVTNTVYIFIALGMILPMLSAASQQSDAVDTGQLLMQWLLPIVLLVPLLVPGSDCFIRRREAKERAFPTNNPSIIENFRNQKLWPIEQTHIGKIGRYFFVLAGAEYLYLFGEGSVSILKHIIA